MYTHFNWMHEHKFASIDVNWFNASVIWLVQYRVEARSGAYLETKPDISWAGVASQYFCSIVRRIRRKTRRRMAPRCGRNASIPSG